MKNSVISISNLGYEKKYKDFYDECILKNDENFFIDKKDVLITSAILGADNFSKSEIDKYSLEEVMFLNNVDFSDYHKIIYSIAIFISKDADVIFNKKKVVEIFNKCAGIGIIKLQEILNKEGDEALRNYEDFLKDLKVNNNDESNVIDILT